MLKQIHLTNFQAHKNTVIDFSPGCNVIVGASDRGKSSVIRALQLVFCNKPSGTAYIRHGSKECTVAVTMASGDTIKRVRTKSKNYYQINDNALLEAPGRDVPLEVMELCPMQDINFQGQHDPAFMLSDTAGEVGRMLNKCVDLTVIDKTLTALNGQRKSAYSQLAFLQEEADKKNADCEWYAQVPAMRKDVTFLKDTVDVLTATDRKKEELDSCLKTCKAAIMWLETHPDPARFLPKLKELESTTQGIEAKKLQVRAIKDVIESVTDAKEALEPLQMLPEALQSLGGIQIKAEALKAAQRCKNDFQTAVEAVQAAQGWLAKAVKEYDAKNAEYTAIMGDTCPLCGSHVGG